jgi:hypothetical protein
MKKIILLIFNIFISFSYFLYGQNMMSKEQFIEQLSKKYDSYREANIKHRRFKHSDLQPLIENLKKSNIFKISTLGKSIEGRTIPLISLGTGQTKILLWSQMHGDESTATMAMFDIFNFFSKNDDFDALKQDFLSKVTLYCIPMLNPDGAEVWKRRNAYDIDLNRDALRLQSPEAVILKNIRDSLNPEFGFNLHDQSIFYTVGNTPIPATISFLAPAYNYAKDINEIRGRAMKLIAELTEMIYKFMPNQVAKYSDDFEPRAFGDNIQKWGTSVVLIESGGYANDAEKQYIRKMNFIALMTGIYSIANQNWQQYTIEQYNAIPFNERLLKSLILRSLSMKKNNKDYKIDVAYIYNEVGINGDRDFYYKNSIDEIGDLSIFYGYKEIDCTGMIAEEGKVYPKKFKDLKEIKKLNIKSLYQEGYTSVILEKEKITEDFTDIGVNILIKTDKRYKKAGTTLAEMGKNPDMVIRQNGKVRYIIINGFVQDIDNEQNTIINALIYR